MDLLRDAYTESPAPAVTAPDVITLEVTPAAPTQPPAPKVVKPQPVYDDLLRAQLSKNAAARTTYERKKVMVEAAIAKASPTDSGVVSVPGCGKAEKHYTVWRSELAEKRTFLRQEKRILTQFGDALLAAGGKPLFVWKAPTDSTGRRASEYAIFKLNLSMNAVPVIADAVFNALRAFAPELDGMWSLYEEVKEQMTVEYDGEEPSIALLDATFGYILFKRIIAYGSGHPSERLEVVACLLNLLGFNVAPWGDPERSFGSILGFLTVSDTAMATAREYVGAHLMNLDLKTYNKYKRMNDV